MARGAAPSRAARPPRRAHGGAVQLSGGRSRDGLPTAQRAEAGGEGRHEGDLRTEVKNTERRRAARSFCAQPLTEEPQVSPLPAEGLMVWGDMRGKERHRPDDRKYAARRGAPRAVWCVLAWRPGRNRRGGSVSLFVRHVLVVASRWGASVSMSM